MADLFSHRIICTKCNKDMKLIEIFKDGFKIRALECERCKEKIIHPQDEAEYKNFVNLKRKNYKVKLRLVGNSYTVSIPKEIVEFMHEQEKIMDDMVRLCFSNARRLSLMFGEEDENDI
ncbi:MAG: hypothetical protein ABIH72_04985 [archaeon]